MGHKTPITSPPFSLKPTGPANSGVAVGFWIRLPRRLRHTSTSACQAALRGPGVYGTCICIYVYYYYIYIAMYVYIHISMNSNVNENYECRYEYKCM